MNALRKKFEASPELARIAPFAVYAVLSPLQGLLGPESRFWIYLVKTVLAAWVIWQVRPVVQEMRWKISWEAVVLGIAIFVAWIGLDGLYPRIGKLDAGADPFQQFGQGSVLAWAYIVVHILGMTFVVPPAEETFYRSFVYRFLVKIDFLA